jgi:hypothetical protein
MSFSNKIAEGDPERKDSFKSKVQRQLSVTSLNDDDSMKEVQLFSMMDVDPALDAKMHIVNNVRRPRFLRTTSGTDFVLGHR